MQKISNQRIADEDETLLSSLSFVFPMYNEIGNIERCIEEALAIGRCLTHDLEIIIVDDASTDGAGALADALASKHAELRVVHHERNRKLGGALKTGFAAATRDWVLYIDSDLPIHMSDALQALPLAPNSDMIIGWRQNRSEGPRRAFMSWVYNQLIRRVFGLKVHDVNFAFKMFRRSLIEKITLRSEGSFIDAELLIEADKLNARFAEIPMNYYPRVAGVSTLASNTVVIHLLREMIAYHQTRFQGTKKSPTSSITHVKS